MTSRLWELTRKTLKKKWKYIQKNNKNRKTITIRNWFMCADFIIKSDEKNPAKQLIESTSSLQKWSLYIIYFFWNWEIQVELLLCCVQFMIFPFSFYSKLSSARFIRAFWVFITKMLIHLSFIISLIIPPKRFLRAFCMFSADSKSYFSKRWLMIFYHRRRFETLFTEKCAGKRLWLSSRKC